MDQARHLYELILAASAGGIQEMVNRRETETLYLDFKESTGTDDLRFFSKAMSGFANASGGVVVWGVQCKQNSEGEDVAEAVRPIGNLRDFVRRLEGRHDLIAPGLNGVEHKPLELTEGCDTGFAVTFIPKSESEPQQAVGKDTHTYYVRIGARTLPMPHFMVADRYRTRPQPKLELDLSLHASTSEQATVIEVGVKNVGLCVAQSPALAIKTDSTFEIYPDWKTVTDQNGLSASAHEDGWCFLTPRSPVTIYPRCSWWIGRIAVKKEKWSTESNFETPDIVINCEVYADGFAASDLQHRVSGEELDRLSMKTKVIK